MNKLDKTEVKGLTRRQAIDYYLKSPTAQRLYHDIRGRPVSVYTIYSGRRVLRRKHKGQPIIIDVLRGDKPNSLEYWALRHAVEFHRTPTTGSVVIDIDPNNVPASRLKQIVADTANQIRDVGSPEVRFSGGRGYYVLTKGSAKKSFKNLYDEVKNRMLDYAAKNKDITVTKRPGPGQTRLDLSPMRRGGTHRAIYSLDARTGLISKPVANLNKFNPIRDAKPPARETA